MVGEARSPRLLGRSRSASDTLLRPLSSRVTLFLLVAEGIIWILYRDVGVFRLWVFRFIRRPVCLRYRGGLKRIIAFEPFPVFNLLAGLSRAIRGVVVIFPILRLRLDVARFRKGSSHRKYLIQAIAAAHLSLYCSS